MSFRMRWWAYDRRGWAWGNCSRRSKDAPPVAAVDVLDDRLRETIGADDVSFLIAHFSGQALIRLEHAGSDLTAVRPLG